MRAWWVFIALFIGAALFYWDWDGKEGKLVRMDIPIEGRPLPLHIMEEDVGDIKSILSKVNWDEDVSKPLEEMDRKLILFYEPPQPARLERLHIWYQQDGSAILYNDYEKQYGKLDRDSIKKLEREIQEFKESR